MINTLTSTELSNARAVYYAVYHTDYWIRYSRDRLIPVPTSCFGHFTQQHIHDIADDWGYTGIATAASICISLWLGWEGRLAERKHPSERSNPMIGPDSHRCAGGH